MIAATYRTAGLLTGVSFAAFISYPLLFGYMLSP